MVSIHLDDPRHDASAPEERDLSQPCEAIEAKDVEDVEVEDTLQPDALEAQAREAVTCSRKAQQVPNDR